MISSINSQRTGPFKQGDITPEYLTALYFIDLVTLCYRGSDRYLTARKTFLSEVPPLNIALLLM